MELWSDVQTLIWLFPILFMLHDFEEIIMIEKWMSKNTATIYNRLPEKLADRVVKQFSMSTAQFSVSVVIIFLIVSSSAFLASQYMNQELLGGIYLFIVCTMVFFLHAFTHMGQSILFRSVTPGVVTSIIIILPYSLILYRALLTNQIITWNTILICLPFVLIFFPFVFIAHWIGKKAIV
ncbi:HXXEE domain-containing protein [Bacillus sp. JJ722]|uniref:HXXEE domain-containing protein n=1 Tax=Bacillus sp. JJ722 TaxID=3122973 RepID=UPI003000C660